MHDSLVNKLDTLKTIGQIIYFLIILIYSWLLFSCSLRSNSLWPHGLQHARLPVLHHLLEFAQTHVHWVDDTIQPSHSLSPPSPPALNLSQHQGLYHIRWPKYWSFSFSISPSSEHSGLISFRIKWFDLLAFQGNLKSSPAPKFESINSLALSLFNGPASISAANILPD